ncbi:outer membrane beta-barrel protein [Flavobacterium anhuiense]|uniref:outer membrane beta-barrel protein n=1 Tax=Flavobacterium anhuiense TaxID=459526 RepID=UPI0034D96D26
MKKTLLLILFLYLTSINAQITFEKGYFISNNGKRTECLIRNLDWRDNPTDFRYKIEPNDKGYVTETIAGVSEFGLSNGTIFKRAKVKIDRSSDDLAKISQTGKPVWEESTLYLKVLITGDASLYSYRDANIIRYFYETKQVPLEQLVYLKYIDNTSEQSSKNLKENTYFRQQLNINVRSSNITDNDIKNLSYTKSDLTKYFIKFNNISADTETKKTSADEEKNIFHVKITPGISLISLSMDSQSLPYRNIKLDNKTNFKIGIEGEYILPFNKNKWSVFLNPMYQKYDNEKSYSVPGLFPTSPVEPHEVTVEYSGLQIPIGIRHYLFLNKSSKFFINAAFNFDAGKSKIVYDKDRVNESTAGSNLTFGFGYNFKDKFGLEARLNTKKDLMNEYNDFSANYGSVDFIFSYTIF